MQSCLKKMKSINWSIKELRNEIEELKKQSRTDIERRDAGGMERTIQKTWDGRDLTSVFFCVQEFLVDTYCFLCYHYKVI